MRRGRTNQRGEVSATELAEMGFCEMRVLLADRFGEASSPRQRQAQTRGRIMHEAYLRDGMDSGTDRRCFIATCIFGDGARETSTFRRYRDTVLLRSCLGRRFVAFYYRTSPYACGMLDRCTPMRSLVRSVLVRFARYCELAMERGGGG